MTALIFDPIYSQLDLPPGHRFPVNKYQMLYDKLCREGSTPFAFLTPEAISISHLKQWFDSQYIDEFVNGDLAATAIRKIGFPWSEQLVRRTLTAVGGTTLAGELSLIHGRAINLSGGYHHGFYDYGSGFCIINDLFLSAANLLELAGINRVLIFDCDVHQGDGTAQLATNNSQIITVSIHSERNFPFNKQQSDIDVALEDGVKDDEYLHCVDKTFRDAINRFKPDAVIYDAGADIHCDDDLGHFDVSIGGVLARDRLVFNHCTQRGLPISAVIGGGYQRNIDQLVDVHLQLFRAADP